MKLKILLVFSCLFFLFSCGETEEIVWKKQIETEPQETKTILALWDSLTAWYTLPLEDSYPMQLEALLQDSGYKYELINAGVSGDTSAQILKRIDLYLEDDSEIPDLAIVVAGANDWLRGQSIDELEDNLTQIVEKLQTKWVTVIIWWMQIPPNRWLKYFNDFKWVYKKVAKAMNAELIDFFLEDVATKWIYNLRDGIHPNKEGYAIISQNIFEFLEKNKLIKND